MFQLHATVTCIHKSRIHIELVGLLMSAMMYLNVIKIIMANRQPAFSTIASTVDTSYILFIIKKLEQKALIISIKCLKYFTMKLPNYLIGCFTTAVVINSVQNGWVKGSALKCTSKVANCSLTKINASLNNCNCYNNNYLSLF